MYLLFNEPKISSETMIAFSFSLRGLISSLISLILILVLDYCSGGDLVIIEISRSGIREKNFNTKNVFFSEKDGPTNCVRLLLLVLTFSIFGFSNILELDSFSCF